MRSEAEMFDLILGVAKRDPRIRAVYMNGSRTNPNVPKDLFQDYDIAYVVEETASFLKDPGWLDVFGPRLMMQEPDAMDRLIGIDMDFTRSYAYLMLFEDGNRIDLGIQTKEVMPERYTEDKLTVPLLDKDGCLPPIPAPSDIDYWVKPPAAPLFYRCCNEFWWCMQNVVKGLWRDELPYARRMYESCVRDMLDEMTGWRIGMEHDYRVSVGKLNKYFKKYLPKAYWKMYVATCAGGDCGAFWDALFASCELFRTLASDVAERFGYSYDSDEDANMTRYFRRVRDLPRDAAEL